MYRTGDRGDIYIFPAEKLYKFALGINRNRREKHSKQNYMTDDKK